MTEYYHQPVMLAEVLDCLRPAPGQCLADGTLGGGGHSRAIWDRMGNGTLFGIDRDEAAIRAASERLKDCQGFRAVHGNFHDVLALLPEGTVLDGGLLDLGVSSYQLDTPERGFSYHEDAPLDMRMDPSRGETAADYLNRVSREELTRILYDYGDERWAARIAQKVTEQRETAPLRTTMDLVRAVDAAIPKAVRRKDDGHPARRTFQAVRIRINDELDPLARALNDWVSLLRPGGRLCVLTFHSIEDRLVKQAFRKMEHPCVCPPKAPVCTCGRKPVARVLFGGAVKPSPEEIARNKRAHSALMRAVEKL